MIAIANPWKQMTVWSLGFDVRDFPPARTPDLPAMRAVPGATGDAISGRRVRYTPIGFK
jgi:hypothetical protein